MKQDQNKPREKASWYFDTHDRISFRFYVGIVKEMNPNQVVFNIGIMWWDFGYAY